MFENLDFAAVLPYALFFAFAAISWALGDFFLNRKNRAESRLEQIRNRMLGKNNPVEKQSGLGSFTKFLEAASPKFGETLKPKSAKEVSKIKQKLASAGFRNENAVVLFTTIKTLTVLGVFALAGGISVLTAGVTTRAIVATAIASMVGLLLPELVVGFIAKKRKQAIFLGLPDALDMLVVCVEAGLGLDQAMRKVCDELVNSHPIIAHEFKLCNQMLQMGQTRVNVLQDLGDRNGVDDLKTLASIMIQCDRFGTSVGTALRTQSEVMRTRRRQIAEEKAAKTAVKLIFPLVVFIFPGIFVVLVGPAAITMINEMLPAFQK